MLSRTGVGWREGGKQRLKLIVKDEILDFSVAQGKLPKNVLEKKVRRMDHTQKNDKIKR